MDVDKTFGKEMGSMATSKGFHDHVVECLQRVGEISTRRMMGEYCVYHRGKLIGDICDDQLFLKPTASVLRLMPEAERAYPYEGSKTLMVVVDDLEDTDRMARVLEEMVKELPEPKKRTKAKKAAKPKGRAGAEKGTEPKEKAGTEERTEPEEAGTKKKIES